jgi:HAD superfamily hydrolase (TIGR01509 family)
MKQLIIFDCDGVLVDSELISSRINAEVFTELGCKLTAEEVAKLLVGVDQKTARKIILSMADITLPENIAELAKERILEACKLELQPLMKQALQLVSKHNINRCVASNNLREKVIKSLEFTDQLQFFNPEYIFTAAQVEKGKPEPDLFLLAAKTLGHQPKECLVIEDSTAGIRAALAANMDVIGFLGGGHAKYPWYKERIEAFNIPIAHNVEELIKLLINYKVPIDHGYAL